jgi:DNA topoisomerase-1
MSKNLLIIESPNKIQTISKFLGSDYKIIATVGHIRDLSVRNGYDPKTLEPNWTIPGLKKKHGPLERAKKEIIAEIKAEASKADNVYIATDPDREGEAIAWHVFEVLDKKDQEKVKRITFNEITKPAIVQALENPRDIDIK